MKISIADLKSHVLGFLSHMGHLVDGVEHRAVANFASFVEGKQAEADSKAYLENLGYTVIDPPLAPDTDLPKT